MEKVPLEYLRGNKDFIVTRNGQEEISGAAILLFGKNPQRFFQRARVRFIRYEGTEARVGTEMNVVKDVIFEGKVLDMVRKATEFVKGQIREYTFLGQDGRFVTIPEPEYRTVEFMLYATLKNHKWVEEHRASTTTTIQDRGQVREQDKEQVTEQDTSKETLILNFCTVPRSRKEIQEYLGLSGRRHFNEAYLKPLLDSGQLVMTIPDKPNSRNQKYVTANKA